MVLNHVAAILLFSGPLFYIGLFLVVAPTGVARVLETAARALGRAKFPQSRLRSGLRLAGLALVVFAIAL